MSDRGAPLSDPELETLELGQADASLTLGADEWTGLQVRPRDLVPTPREESLGAAKVEPVFEAVEQPREKLSVRGVVRRWASDADPRAIEGPKRYLFILALLFVLASWDDTALGIVLPEMRTEFGISLTFLATIGSLMGILNLGLSLPAGYLADRVKRVWMVRAGALITNFASIWQGLAPGVGHIVGARVAAGTAGALTGPATYPLLADYIPSRSRARAFAFLAIAGQLGGLVGPIVAGVLAATFGWRVAVVSLGVLATGVAALTFVLKEPVRGYLDRVEMGADEQAASVEQSPVRWGEAWRAAASIVTVRRLWYAEPFLHIGGQGLGLILVLYYSEVFQVSLVARGYLGSLAILVGIAGLMVGGPVADRLLSYRPGRVVTLVSLITMFQASVFVLLGLSPSLVLSVVFSLPAAFFGAMLGPALITLMSLVVPARMRGLGMQTGAPFRLIGLLAYPFVISLTSQLGLRAALFSFAPLLFIGAMFIGSAALGVERDIRAAKAASMAEEEIRRAKEQGRSKILVARDVDVTYGGTQVLFGVDLDVDEGEIVALLGTNGAGKSSLLRAIAGLHEASNGAIFLDGIDITHVPPEQNAQSGVVFVPGGRAIFPSLTVEENLKAAAWLRRQDDAAVKEGFEQVYSFFPILKERLNQPAGNLSGGEQQMVALGQVFLMQPRLLMIDELSLGLAPAIVHRLLETLRAINASGTTIILVEQSINVAVTIADRAVFMEKGEVRFDGPTQELLRRPELVRAVFFGAGATAGVARKPSGSIEESSSEELLKVRDISVEFGGISALRSVDLSLSAAEIVGIIGPNGAGKTTLFDVISGFVQPNRGSVTLASTDITWLSPDGRARLGLGRSFQNATLFPSMTVRENIAVALDRHLTARSAVLSAAWAPQIRKAERKVARRVDDLIYLLGLEAYADKFIDELSTGTRRAVDIACILASEPQILLLDEPSSGLAQAETEELAPVLSRLVRDTGAGLLVIEHDIPLVSKISDRMIALELGSVIATGTPDEVLKDPAVLASYLSASPEVVARSGGSPTTVVQGVVSSLGSSNGASKEREIDE